MRKEETIERNLTLIFDFLQQVIKNPKIIDDLPNGSEIEFVQKDLPIVEFKKKQHTRYFKVKYQFEKI